MNPTITAFETSPDRGRGFARDMPVRWALEEVRAPYDVRLVSFEAMKQPAHLTQQPFGQIPSYEAGELSLFESGAIVLHVAERFGGLLPEDANARSRAIAWMFSAVATVEPPIVAREQAILTERDKPWHAERLPLLDARIATRLKSLSDRLGDADWLDGEFSAGDLMMVSTLRRPAAAEALKGFANLAAYVARAEARSAFKKAFAAQRAVWEAGNPHG